MSVLEISGGVFEVKVTSAAPLTAHATPQAGRQAGGQAGGRGCGCCADPNPNLKFNLTRT